MLYYNNACADYSRQKMSSASFKLDGNTPTVTWADPKNSPDHSASSQVISRIKVECKVNVSYCFFYHSVKGFIGHVTFLGNLFPLFLLTLQSPIKCLFSSFFMLFKWISLYRKTYLLLEKLIVI